MGGIKSHRKGIQVTFYWNGERFRPTLKIPPTAKNIQYAEKLKGAIELSIAHGTYDLEQYARHFPTSRIARTVPERPAAVTFKKMSEVWLAASSHLSKGTLIKYRQALDFWLDRIGEDQIDSIQYSTIAALSNAQGWNAKNRNNMLIPLRQVFEMAFLDGIVESNPSKRIKNSKVQIEQPDPLTAEEVELVLGHMQKYGAQILNLFEFSIFTGMRPSELIALRWGDIDQMRGLAKVTRARTYLEEHETKTYRERNVELNKRAKAALERQKQHTFLKSEYVFESPETGKPFTSERPLRETYWNRTLKAIGLRARHCYQTRHTFATLNLMAGANPMWVSKQLGHTNMQMVLKVYGKWIDGADKSNERGKIDLMFSATATNSPPRQAEVL